ncbi:MAG: GTP-binding protein [Terricaulis sp.]|nr:GTP-binding protein [Terricaulis sp.]
MAEAPITPVWILTGFLGSGKTTLLSRLMRHPGMSDTAVIVNEFGEVGLDHRLVAQSAETNVLLLDSGCLCCAMGDDLAETLTELFHKRARGEIPDFRRVVIETTGLADPGPIIGTLLADRVMTSRYRIAGVIAVADGVLGADQLLKHREAQRQTALADRIIISKRDQITEADEAGLRARLSAANPRAEILSIAQGDVAPEALLAPPQERRCDGVAHTAACGHDHAHDHAEHRHSEAVETVFAPFPKPMDWSDYAAMVAFLQRRLGADLWRTKGIVRIKGEPEPMVIQGVQHLFAPPAQLPEASQARFGIVLIGERLGGAALIEALAPFGAAAG